MHSYTAFHMQLGIGQGCKDVPPSVMHFYLEKGNKCHPWNCSLVAYFQSTSSHLSCLFPLHSALEYFICSTLFRNSFLLLRLSGVIFTPSSWNIPPFWEVPHACINSFSALQNYKLQHSNLSELQKWDSMSTTLETENKPRFKLCCNISHTLQRQKARA